MKEVTRWWIWKANTVTTLRHEQASTKTAGEKPFRHQDVFTNSRPSVNFSWLGQLSALSHRSRMNKMYRSTMKRRHYRPGFKLTHRFCINLHKYSCYCCTRMNPAFALCTLLSMQTDNLHLLVSSVPLCKCTIRSEGAKRHTHAHTHTHCDTQTKQLY